RAAGCGREAGGGRGAERRRAAGAAAAGGRQGKEVPGGDDRQAPCCRLSLRESTSFRGAKGDSDLGAAPHQRKKRYGSSHSCGTSRYSPSSQRRSTAEAATGLENRARTGVVPAAPMFAARRVT